MIVSHGVAAAGARAAAAARRVRRREDTSSARRYAFDVLVVDEAHHVAPASPTAATGFRGYAVDSQRTRRHQGAGREVRAPAVPVRDPAQRLLRVVHRADGDDRRPPVHPRREPGRARAARHRGPPAQGRPGVAEGVQARELKIARLHPRAATRSRSSRCWTRSSPRARGADGREPVGWHRGDAAEEAVPVQPVVVRADAAPLRRRRRRSGHRGRRRGLVYQEVFGSGQSDEEEGAAEHPEFTALRHSKRSDPLGRGHAGRDRLADRMGPGLREPAGLPGWTRCSRSWTRSAGRTAGRGPTSGSWCSPSTPTTLDWIVRRPGPERLPAEKARGHPGLDPPEEREDIRAQFTAPPAEQPVRVLVATDSAGEGIDLQDHCHRLVNFDIPFNPSRLEQRIGRIDRYGQQHTPEVYQLRPGRAGIRTREDTAFLLDKVAEKIGQVAADLGSVNQVIDAEIQDHFTPARHRGRKVKLAAGDDGSVDHQPRPGRRHGAQPHPHRAVADYDDRKAEMHLTPANARRVVDTALELTSQPPLIPLGDDDPARGLRGPGARVRVAVRAARPRHPAEARRAAPDHVRPGGGGRGRGRRLGSTFTSGTRCCSAPRASCARRCSASDSPVHRVTAVVVDGLPQSCVAAVSRLVLVGRGGLRLHEEVFLTGIRLRGSAMAEAKVEQVLDQALDAQDLILAGEEVRRALAEQWNADGAPLRTRLLAAMEPKAPQPSGAGDRHAVQAARLRHRPGPGDLRRVPRQPPGIPRSPRPQRSAARKRNCSPTTSSGSASMTSPG